MSNCDCSSENCIEAVDSDLCLCSKWTSFKYRVGIKRDQLRVKPGVYSIGQPGKDSYLFVTSNLQISFDKLRKNLAGLDAWILVIDTLGVNVWCAAGKGTFGTDELLDKIKEFNVKNLDFNKKVILPQLGAPGVSAYKVAKETGLRMIWGPVRAEDIKMFLDNKLKKTNDMRRVEFNFLDRLAVVPLELIAAAKYFFFISLILLLVSGLSSQGLLFKDIALKGLPVLYGFTLAWLSGNLFVPMLLPVLPFRMFSLKGFLVGAIVSIVYNLFFVTNIVFSGLFIGTVIMNSAFSAFWALNFTGCTTFTSPSGVEKEMSIMLKPVFIVFVTGFLITILSLLGVV